VLYHRAKYIEKLCGETSLRGFSFSYFYHKKEKGKAIVALSEN
jgi:hypothetical protein